VSPPSHPVRAAIALGSNLGDRVAALRGALGALDALDGVAPADLRHRRREKYLHMGRELE